MKSTRPTRHPTKMMKKAENDVKIIPSLGLFNKTNNLCILYLNSIIFPMNIIYTAVMFNIYSFET